MNEIDPHSEPGEILRLLRENNRMLKGMRNAARWAAVFRALYWILIIVSLIAGYLFLKPFLDQATTTLESIQAQSEQLQNINLDGFDFSSIQELFR